MISSLLVFLFIPRLRGRIQEGEGRKADLSASMI